MPPSVTRWKVMLATSDQAASARRVAVIWPALKALWPEVPSGRVVTKLSRKAKVTTAA